MANREKRERAGFERTLAVPSQQEEADIIQEVGAEPGEDGELEASVEDIRKAGAIDAETVRQNRHTENVAKRKVKGEKVSFSTDDPLKKYEGLLKTWPNATMHVKTRRISGGPETMRMDTSNPRTATELYEVIKVAHGQCGEATYEVEFLDAGDHTWRGKAKITMPDTRVPFQQGQQPPMPYGYPPPNGAPYYPPQPQPAPQPTNGHAQPPQQPPQIFVQPPAGPDMGSMMASFQDMFRMFQEVQRTFTPPAAPQSQYPQQPPMMPPPPPSTSSPAEQMAWMQEMFRVFQQMQQMAVRGHLQPQPQPQQTPMGSMPAMGPTSPAPRGYQWVWRPDFGAHVLMPETSVAPPQGPMYRPRAPYYPQGDPNGPPYAPPQQRPQPQLSPADQVRDALGVVRQTMSAVREMGSVLGQDQQQHHFEAPQPEEPDSDSPVRIVKTQDGELVYDQDGTLRGWDTILARIPNMMKWVGEQREAIQKAAAERQRPPLAQQQQLPPGIVEMRPGYVPPKGFVAVPITEEGELPPPPSEVPPPIQEGPWGAPTTPENRRD